MAHLANHLWAMILLLAPTLTSLQPAIAQQVQQSTPPPITLPGCPDKCGDITIPYPFGTKAGCFLPGFEVVCNDTFNPPRPFLANPALDNKTNPVLWVTDYCTNPGCDESIPEKYLPVELIDVSVPQGQARVYAAFSYVCHKAGGYSSREQLIDTPATTPFILSATGNVLVGIGRGVLANLAGAWPNSGYGANNDGYMAICASILNPSAATDRSSCTGLGCCQTGNMPPLLRCGNVKIQEQTSSGRNASPCSYGMLVQKSWYNFSAPDIDDDGFLRRNIDRGVPVVIDFAIRPAGGQPVPWGNACASSNSIYVNSTNGPGYICKCKDGYNGNPYVNEGCQDINECTLRDVYPCSSDGICVNRPGGYDCPCKQGMKGDGKLGTCTEKFPLPAKVAVGAICGLLLIAILVFVVLLHKEKGKMREFFEKNGGPILEKANNIKIFKKEELKPILKNSNIVGKGNFGEVYKGHLGDNQLVAVKKSVNVNVAQKEQFANEVIIQSRIIHKNIVKLIGCCLEVDIPMLVYEFVSRGSLQDILHGSSRDPLNLDVRLNIAAESADGLAYMHSKTTTTILHGDVKPANILLDDNFLPKISDFGISRLIAIDKEQHTDYVIGDKSYMDPVYLQTGLLTKKSDVYSFGVVLLELISRKKPTYSDNNSLVMSFLDAHKKNEKATELFDKDIVVPKDLELLHSLAGIAVECLNLDVDQRPEMTDVAERLLMLNRSWYK